MYVFDEPTIGLHPRDVGRMNALLHRLRDKGNTVLVVEHDTDVITAADHVVELGPRCRRARRADRLPGRRRRPGELGHADRRVPAPAGHAAGRPRTPTGHLRVAGRDGEQPARLRPRRAARRARRGHRGGRVGQVHAGPRGARAPAPGHDRRRPVRGGHLDPLHPGHLDRGDGPASASCSPGRPGRSPRCSASTPPARARPARASASSTPISPTSTASARCAPTATAAATPSEVLALTVDGLSISDALDLTAARAVEFFDQRDIRKRLSAVVDVGLGYLTLGQPLSTLSGGECQRLKLAGRLHEEGNMLRAGRADDRSAHVRLRAPARPAGPARRRRQLGDRGRAQPRRRRARGLGDRPRSGRRRRAAARSCSRDRPRSWSGPRARSPASTWRTMSAWTLDLKCTRGRRIVP